MKTFIIGLIFLFSGCVRAIANAGEVHADVSPFSLRLRPMALAFGIYGGEFYYSTPSGYFAGVTAQIADASNDDKGTELDESEFGVKIGKFFGDFNNDSGWWVQGAIDLNRLTVSNFYQGTQQNLSAKFTQFSESLTAGYQFRMTFLDPDRLNIRFGAGIAYKPAADTQRVVASNGARIPIGVRQRLDPTLEFTFGYML